MTAITVTPASVVPGANAKIRRGTSGATITAGLPLYEDASALDASGKPKLKIADADASALTKECVGIALNGASANQPVSWVEEDDDFTPGATLTVGEIYVLGATAGEIVPVGDLAAEDYPVVLFIAKTAAKARLKIVRGDAVVPTP
jgi:hypothetical protein